MADNALLTALAGLQAQSAGLAATSNNIANANTAGYSREQVQLSPLQPSGVLVAGVSQVTDPMLAANALSSGANSASANAYQGLMQTVESAFPEPGTTGLQAQLSSFWSAWDGVANDPSQPATRTQVLNFASNLVTGLNQASVTLASTQQSVISQVGSVVSDVNSLLSRVATLNTAVVAAGTTGSGNALVDQRNQLLTSLSSDIGVTTRLQTDGSVNVYVGGLALVQGDVADTLSVSNSGGVVSVNSAHTGGAVPVQSGTIGGLLQGVNVAIPHWQSQLDAVAANLASTVNARQAAGVTAAGAPGQPLFVSGSGGPVTATTIAVNPAVQADPTQLAAAAPGAGPLDGSNAQAMAELGSSPTGPDQAYRVMIGNLGSAVQSATSSATTQAAFSQQAQAANQSVSGVNSDDEMVQMLSYQHAYQAAAKLMSVVDSTLQSLMAVT